MYDPQHDALDFEIGAFGDRFKKAMKGAAKGLKKVTDVTIVKPSAAIGGAIGGKRGREWGEKLGKITQKATHLGVAAGAAGAALPIATSPMGVTAITAGVAGKVGKKLLKRKKAKARAKAKHAKRRKITKKKKVGYVAKKRHSCNTREAAKVGALLTKALGGPLSAANKALKLAELQRTATYEHKKLMTDANFRKSVLQGIAQLAGEGNAACQKTIRVIMSR